MKADPRRRDPANYPWSWRLQPRFADMDINRHLNNVSITRFFEEARIRFNWQLFEGDAPDARPRYLVAHVAVDYLAEGSYPDPLLLTYAVGNIGTSSFRCLMGMFQNGICIALSDTVLVHRGEHGPAPLTPELRERLERWPLKG